MNEGGHPPRAGAGTASIGLWMAEAAPCMWSSIVHLLSPGMPHAHLRPLLSLRVCSLTRTVPSRRWVEWPLPAEGDTSSRHTRTSEWVPYEQLPMNKHARERSGCPPYAPRRSVSPPPLPPQRPVAQRSSVLAGQSNQGNMPSCKNSMNSGRLFSFV